MVGIEGPVGFASGIQNQRDPSACVAFGTNWTFCDRAFSSDDEYATSGFLRPDGTVSNTSWTPQGAATHHQATDETVPNGDTDYVTTGTQGALAEVSLTDIDDPQTNASHIVRFTGRSLNGAAGQEKAKLLLYQGATQVANLNVNLDRTAYTTHTSTLTAAEAEAITDYSDLRLRLEAINLDAGEEIRVTQMEFEVPSSADTAWRGYGFALNQTDTVSRVEVGIEWHRRDAVPALNVTVSWDGGTTWAANQTASNKSADDDTVEWLNFTSATSWDASKLSDANFRVRVGTNATGARLDYVSVRVNFDRAPSVTNFRLEDGAGTTQAGQQLDVDALYYFLFNVTDDDGWSDIGGSGNVSLRLWYDGNVSPELTFGEQTTGANYRIVLTYQDTADPSTATLAEWSVTEGRATYDAAASSLTSITSGATVIGYEFKLALKLGFQVKHAVDPTNATTGGYNDRDSWNAEVTATDGTSTTTLQTASTGVHMEFGVFQYTFVSIGGNWSVSVAPGQTGNTNTVTVTRRSNDDFTLKIWFVTHLVKGSDTVSIANVEILAAADPDDDITSDQSFGGLGEGNAIYILGSDTLFFSHSVDTDGDTSVVQFRVTIPLGTLAGTYVAQLTVKLEQRPP